MVDEQSLSAPLVVVVESIVAHLENLGKQTKPLL